MGDLRSAGVAETARLVAGGEVPVRQVVSEALARIQADDAGLNAFSVVLGEQALKRLQRTPPPDRHDPLRGSRRPPR